jgi:large subunit ribosomal protein L22
MRATLRNYRQSPRKVRLLVDLIRGKAAPEAVTLLAFTPKRASLQVKKLLESAIANAAHVSNIAADELYVSKATVDQGVTIGRWMPRARGSSSPIRKRCSHIVIELARKGEKKGAAKVKAAAAPEAEKPAKVAPKATKKASPAGKGGAAKKKAE